MKRWFFLLVGLFSLILLAASLVVFFKGGSSIFYAKYQVPVQELIPQENVFRFQFRYNDLFYDPDSVLILEGGSILERVGVDTVLEKDGTYAVENSQPGKIEFSISPLHPIADQGAIPVYQVYIRPYLASNNVGGLVLLVLTSLLILFFRNLLKDSGKRQVLLASPLGLLKLWQAPFTSNSQEPVKFRNKSTCRQWLLSAADLALLVYLYIFMEWVFLVTKPSFLDILPLWSKIKILIVICAVTALFFLAVLLIFYFLNLLIRNKLPLVDFYIRHILTAFLAACLCLILLDNFTYTVSSFGIVSSRLITRLGYGLAFIVVFSILLRKLATTSTTVARENWRKRGLIAAILLIFSIFITITSIKPHTLTSVGGKLGGTNRPHVIILGSDGLNADNMSVYGYERDTTPFLRELAQTSLLSENHFTNSGHSMGTDAALLTGKLPLTTRALYPPDTLKGADMYQHLPGIMLRSGYRTVQLAVPYYVDANIMNLKDAFVEINCEPNTTSAISSSFSGFGFDYEAQFLYSTGSRISERLMHIFFIKDMQNPFKRVTDSTVSELEDSERMGCLRSYLKQSNQSNQPLFAHIHLMSTHGARFYPAEQVFSRGIEQRDDWMTDFYDDAILDFDREVKKLVEFLIELGEYDNTLLVIYTDHGQSYVTHKRLPLLIHFPGDQYAGAFSENSQTIDIAPTILDYLGTAKPAWMEGDSLLQKIDPYRIILSAKTMKVELDGGRYAISPRMVQPPFYQFSRITAVQCQNLFLVNLVDLSTWSSQVENYAHPCNPQTLYDEPAIWADVGTTLTAAGYSLPLNWP